MKRIAFSILVLVFLSTFFYSCKKETTSPLVGNWTVTDTTTFNTTTLINNLTLNIPDNVNYNMKALSTSTASNNYPIGSDTGTYSYSSNIITFTSTSGTSPCLNNAGTYNFSISGNYLTLSPVTDSCYFSSYPRSAFISSSHWYR